MSREKHDEMQSAGLPLPKRSHKAWPLDSASLCLSAVLMLVLRGSSEAV